MATSSMTLRMDASIKKQAQIVFSQLGLDLTTAINVFLRQAISYNGFPFEVRNHSNMLLTEKVLEEAMHGENMHGPFSTVEELMEDLDA